MYTRCCGLASSGVLRASDRIAPLRSICVTHCGSISCTDTLIHPNTRFNFVGARRTTVSPDAQPPALILVVDDEAAVTRLVTRYLNHLGYRTLEATSGEEALAVVRRARPRVDLVLSDVIMPEMGGLEPGPSCPGPLSRPERDPDERATPAKKSSESTLTGRSCEWCGSRSTSMSYSRSFG